MNFPSIERTFYDYYHEPHLQERTLIHVSFCFCSGPSDWLTGWMTGWGGAGGLSAASWPFALTRSRHSRSEGIQLPPGYFLPRSPPPFSPSNCRRHSRRRRAATFNQSPKIAPEAWWAGGCDPSRVHRSHVLQSVLP